MSKELAIDLTSDDEHVKDVEDCYDFHYDTDEADWAKFDNLNEYQRWKRNHADEEAAGVLNELAVGDQNQDQEEEEKGDGKRGKKRKSMDDDGFEVYDEKSFRFNATSVFLTYPKFDISPEAFFGLWKSKIPGTTILKHVISREEHKDGTFHLHAYFLFSKKIDTKNPRFFDVEGHHPNIKVVTRTPDKVFAYIMKHGNYITDVDLVGSNWKNYIRRKADLEAWSRDMQHRNLPLPPAVITLPEGQRIEPLKKDRRTGVAIKKRHIWLWGPANTGKTTWALNTFGQYQVFWRPAKTEYPFETYGANGVYPNYLIYDDVIPTWDEVTDVSNTVLLDNQKHVFGKARYTNKYWKGGVTKVMIVLANNPISTYTWHKDPVVNDSLIEAMLKRFNEFSVTRNEEIDVEESVVVDTRTNEQRDEDETLYDQENVEL